MSVEIITILLFASLFLLLFLGMPVAFAIGAVAVAFTIGFWGFDHLPIMAISGYGSLQDTNLVAVPLFILMGWILSKSGIADDLFDTMYVWMGNVSGGLAMGTVLISALFGAICGDMVAAIFTITVIALPALMKRGYNKHLAVGCILAGALLSFLIPPSIAIIIFASVTGISVGKLYLACFIPGFFLAGLYIAYIYIRCRLKPELGPSATSETDVSWRIKFIKLKGVVAPLILLLSMLIGIYSGAFTPMEASAVGAVGAFICAAIKRRLSWKVVWEATFTTLRLSCMIGWMFIAVGCFSAVYSGMGAADLARSIAGAVPGGGLVVVIVMQFIIIISGMLMDANAITMILGPIFMGVIKSLGFDPFVFGTLFMINMQTAILSPPYGFGLFYMKSVIKNLPESYDISTGDIVRAALPFAGLQILCLAIVLIFQPLATFLPDLLI